MHLTTKITLNRDARAGALIARLVARAVHVPPARRETLFARAERIMAWRRRHFTAKTYRRLCAEAA